MSFIVPTIVGLLGPKLIISIAQLPYLLATRFIFFSSFFSLFILIFFWFSACSLLEQHFKHHQQVAPREFSQISLIYSKTMAQTFSPTYCQTFGIICSNILEPLPCWPLGVFVAWGQHWNGTLLCCFFLKYLAPIWGYILVSLGLPQLQVQFLGILLWQLSWVWVSPSGKLKSFCFFWQ